jgi:hypothetical protein
MTSKRQKLAHSGGPRSGGPSSLPPPTPADLAAGTRDIQAAGSAVTKDEGLVQAEPFERTVDPASIGGEDKTW